MENGGFGWHHRQRIWSQHCKRLIEHHISLQSGLQFQHGLVFRFEWRKTVDIFSDSTKIRLISVIFHDNFGEDDNTLIIGHTGILLPASDALYFVEKVAFQEPYRFLKFKNRTELSDYLMLKYDTAWGQDTAHPFVLENDTLMDGWRILDASTET